MRFLANENVALAAVEGLRASGHDVVWVHSDEPGSSDARVLERARGESRVLLTFDTDFGRLVFHQGAKASRGLILFRVPVMSPVDLARFIVASVNSRYDWEDHFSVVELRRVRMRRLHG